MSWVDSSNTVEETYRKRQFEWKLVSIALFTLAFINFVGFLSAVFLIPAGQIFGAVIFDQIFSLLMIKTVFLYSYAGYVVGSVYICRFCSARMRPEQFRCAKCAKHHLEDLKQA